MQTAQVNSVQDVSEASAISRIKRDGYVSNLDPAFKRPEQHKGRPHKIIKATNYARKRDVLNWAGFRVLLSDMGRQRFINEHRRRAANAMVQAVLHYVNLITWEVECPVSELTRLCELHTVSKTSGAVSITRGSRVIQMFQRLGAMTGELIWDKTQGTWTTKYLEVTERFWEMLGLDPKEMIEERVKRFADHEKLGMTISEAGRMSLTEYRMHRRILSIQRGFEIRHNIRQAKSDRKRAKRLAAMTKDEQRKTVGEYLFIHLDNDTISFLAAEPSRFDKMVTKEMNRLLRLVSDSPDTH